MFILGEGNRCTTAYTRNYRSYTLYNQVPDHKNDQLYQIDGETPAKVETA